MEKKKQKWMMDDIQYEREEERAESRKVYQMKNGLRMMVLSGEPLHCRNTKTGRYEEIGNRLVSGKEGSSVLACRMAR